jgi:type VI secretion system protein ImpK
MPITPLPSPADSDTDTLFGTEMSVRPGPPRNSAKPPGRGASSGPNPLITEADALLALVPQLRSTAQITDLAQLRARIVGLLQRFDERLRQRGVAPAQAQKAHFVLCALIDEVVDTMPWGAGGRWERLNPLKAAVGPVTGDTTVRVFAQLAADRSSRDLRKLIYVALALGFDARGRGPTGGPRPRAPGRIAEAKT